MTLGDIAQWFVRVDILVDPDSELLVSTVGDLKRNKADHVDGVLDNGRVLEWIDLVARAGGREKRVHDGNEEKRLTRTKRKEKQWKKQEKQ